MGEERIAYKISEQGSERTSAQFKKVSGSLSDMQAKAAVAGTKFGGLASAAGTLGSVVSQSNPQISQFAIVIATAGGSVDALTTALGGPLGLTVGGLVVALAVYTTYSRLAEDQTEETTDALDRQRKSISELAAEFSKARSESAAFFSSGDLRSKVLAIEFRLRDKGLSNQDRRGLEIRKKLLAIKIKEQEEANAEIDRLKREFEVADSLVQDFEPSSGKKRTPLIDRTFESDKTRDLGSQLLSESQARIDAELSAEKKRAAELERIKKEERRKQKRWEAEDRKLRQARLKEELEAAEKLAKAAEERAAIIKGIFTEAAQGIAGITIEAFQQVAKGNKVTVEQILEGIGQQMVADGTKLTFDGLGRVISSYGSDGSGYGLIALGAAEIAAGVGLGAIGSSSAPSGSSGTVNPRSLQPRDSGGDGSGGNITINLGSVVSPGKRDAENVQRAIEEGRRRGL